MSSEWKWEFDPVAMSLSFGGLTVAILLCDKQSQQISDAEIDVDVFVEAQERLGAKIAALLNGSQVRHPLALATVQLKEKQ